MFELDFKTGERIVVNRRAGLSFSSTAHSIPPTAQPKPQFSSDIVSFIITIKRDVENGCINNRELSCITAVKG